MDWLDSLSGTTVGLDTAPLIYLIEENPVYLPFVRRIFNAMDRGEFRVVTSALTLTEVLVHPLRKGDHSVAAQYRQILLSAHNLITIPVSPEIAERAAQLRAEHSVRTPDAIQLATAVHAGAGSFITNDIQLSRFPSLQVLVLDQLIAGVR